MLNTIASVVVILTLPFALSLHLWPRWIPKLTESLYCWFNAHCWGADDYQGPGRARHGQPYESCWRRILPQRCCQWFARGLWAMLRHTRPEDFDGNWLDDMKGRTNLSWCAITNRHIRRHERRWWVLQHVCKDPYPRVDAVSGLELCIGHDRRLTVTAPHDGRAAVFLWQSTRSTSELEGFVTSGHGSSDGPIGYVTNPRDDTDWLPKDTKKQIRKAASVRHKLRFKTRLHTKVVRQFNN